MLAELHLNSSLKCNVLEDLECFKCHKITLYPILLTKIADGALMRVKLKVLTYLFDPKVAGNHVNNLSGLHS
jgi:hypothetical protein